MDVFRLHCTVVRTHKVTHTAPALAAVAAALSTGSAVQGDRDCQPCSAELWNAPLEGCAGVVAALIMTLNVWR